MSNPHPKDIFKTDIEEMMFGFGDQWPPRKRAPNYSRHSGAIY